MSEIVGRAFSREEKYSSSIYIGVEVMKIAICDDEEAQIGLAGRLIHSWSEKSGQPVEVYSFRCAEEFLFRWSEDKSFDLLFLDIQMKDVTGIELAKTIRESDEKLIIIFVTGFTEYVFQGYDVSALHYLLKPVKEKDLFICLDRAKSILDVNDEKYLVFTAEGDNVRVRLSDIKYVEVMAHYINIYTKNDTYNLKKSISNFEKELDTSLFIRCHRSYIVNLCYVDRITKADAVLDDGRLVPISRQKWDGFNQAFIKYFRGCI